MLDTDRTPLISILVAARNEEESIINCLEAIERLDYPINCVEVLIGNDQSTDRTATLVNEFNADKPWFRLIEVLPGSGALRGKTNVLAQLAQQARGQFFFFTDADTTVSPNWLGAMSHYLRENTGVVTGITLPDGPTLFHKLQAIDWLYNLTLTHLLSLFGQPVTAMGNNMAVSRKAYDSVGGYESIPFSVVEDYGLFQAIVKKKYSFRNLLDKEVLAQTKPVETMHAFLQQRKRWMNGAMQLPAWMVTALYGQYLAAPFLLLLSFFFPWLAIGLYATKIFFQTLIISFGISRLNQARLWPYGLLFEPYLLVIGPLSVLYYFLPTRINWKGRTYQ